jgi:hypothetical protein
MSWDLTGLFTGIAAPGAVVVFRRLVPRYLSAARASTHRDANMPEEDFAHLQWVTGLSALVVAGVLGFASYRLPIVANQVIADSDGPAAFRLPPTKALWIFLPMFGERSV